jgi:hypothetical protein
MSADRPVFVVGVPRSGTTLLAAMLAAHSSFSCGPETHFFAALAKTDVRRLLRRRSWPEAAARFLRSIRLEGDRVTTSYGLSEELVLSKLRQRRPSVPAMLACVTEPLMQQLGKRRWVEKSPIHLLYLPSIRRYYPEACIVRVVRDPRDVALSLCRVAWGPNSFAEGLLYWRRFHDASAAFFDRDRRAHSLRYEDLVRQPETELQRLCGFLGEPFDSGMLSFERGAARLVRPAEDWKQNVLRPLDAGRTEVWKQELSTGERSQAVSVVGDCLVRHGYPPGVEIPGPDRFVQIHPLSEVLGRPAELLPWLLAGRVRLWPDARREAPRLVMFVGEPDTHDWLGSRRWSRLGVAMRLVGRALRGRLLGRPVYWVGGTLGWKGNGLLGKLLTIALRPVVKRISPDRSALELRRVPLPG